MTTIVATGMQFKQPQTADYPSRPSGYISTDPTFEPDGAAPITYNGKSIVIDSNRMAVDHPYGLVYRGKQAVAIKRADGSIDIYRIP